MSLDILVWVFLLALDGQKGHTITCSGTAQAWSACYEKAGAICGGKGYDVLVGGLEQAGVISGGVGSEQGAVISGDGISEQRAVIGGAEAGVSGGSTMTRNMLIRCKR